MCESVKCTKYGNVLSKCLSYFFLFWDKILYTQNEGREGLFSLQFMEVSVHTQLAARQDGVASGQPFIATTYNRSIRTKVKSTPPFLPYVVCQLPALGGCSTPRTSSPSTRQGTDHKQLPSAAFKNSAPPWDCMRLCGDIQTQIITIKLTNCL